MNNRLRKRLTYATIAFYYVCSGIEYAVIFPTIWAYLQFLGARDENLLGVSVAAFSLSSMLASPIIGRWFDRTQNAKHILIVMNIFEIAGGVLYFFAPYPWFVVLSRFICGLGGSSGTAVMADVTQSSSIESRTAIMSNFQACRQIGLLVGPVFNLVLRELDFSIFNFPVNKLTAPGIFMAILGCILEVCCLTIYFNLGKMERRQKLVDSLRYDYGSSESDTTADRHHRPHGLGGSQPSVNSEPECYEYDSETDVAAAAFFTDFGDCRHCNASRQLVLSQSQGSDEMMEDAEKFMGAATCHCNRSRPRSLTSRSVAASLADPADYGCVVNSSEVENNVVGYVSIWNDCCQEFLRDEVVALLGLSFISFFAQTVLETIVTPLSQKFYDFADFENSLLFLFAGIEIFLTFVAINFLSRKFQDRTLILVGSCLMIFSLTWYLIFVPSFNHGDWSSLPYFIVGIFANLLGISLLIGCCISLFSKLISKERQGLGHGIRRTMLCAGMILGPLWGGATIDMLVVLFSVPLALIVLFTILFCVSFPKLKVQSLGDQWHVESTPVHEQRDHRHMSKSADSHEERRPLLSAAT